MDDVGPAVDLPFLHVHAGLKGVLADTLEQGRGGNRVVDTLVLTSGPVGLVESRPLRGLRRVGDDPLLDEAGDVVRVPLELALLPGR